MTAETIIREIPGGQEAVKSAASAHFNKMPAIIFDLCVEGTPQAKEMRITFTPGKP